MKIFDRSVGKLVEKLGKPRDRNVESGVVEDVKKVGKHLSFVTLQPLDYDASVRVPVYLDVDRSAFLGRDVDIVSQREGLFGSTFRQNIEASGVSQVVTLPYGHLKAIHRWMDEHVLFKDDLIYVSGDNGFSEDSRI